MSNWRAILAAAMVGTAASTAAATEPNETFATATVLGPTVRTASDELTPGFSEAPDTLLAAVDEFGFIIDENDDDDGDDNPFGDDFASVLLFIDVNFDDSIRVAVTGTGDDFYEGFHDEAGAYDVIIDVFDSEGFELDTIIRSDTLQPGDVDFFSFADPQFFGGSYDVYIDNLVGPIVAGDVDFFRFTGLTPGTLIAAETFDPANPIGSEIDTTLGVFSAGGALQRLDEDGGEGFLSKLLAVVPASGVLTFAVTGHEDDGFVGEHFAGGDYDLRLTTGDFNHDGSVTATDLAMWRSAFGVAGNAGGDADFDGDSDGADFLIWQRERGSVPPSFATVSEPRSIALVVLALMCDRFTLKRRRNSSYRAVDGCPRARCG